MKMKIVLVTTCLVGLAIMGQAKNGYETADPKFTAGANLGYYSGFGLQLNATAAQFAQGFPLRARLGIGYSKVEPGNAAGARVNFINDATNGTPEEKGHTWDFRLDFMYPMKLFSMPNSYFIFGPRHTRFTGNFKYVGGNEDFDVTGTQWGLGAGAESHFAMSQKVSLVMGFGLDYLFDSRLTGHDTSYSPDGDNVNPRDGYDYDTADDVINQPNIEPRVMLGFSYAL